MANRKQPKGDIPADGRNRPLVTALLRQDHEHVDGLFQVYEATDESDAARRTGLVEKIREALIVHTAAEEEIFYSALERSSAEAASLIGEARREHREVERLLADLAGLDPSEEAFDDKVLDLIEDIRHHVHEEESDLFTLAHKHLEDGQLEEMGAAFRARKESLREELGIEEESHGAIRTREEDELRLPRQ